MILDNQLMFTGTSNGATAGITSGPYTDSPTTGSQNSSNIIDLHIAAASLWAPVLASGQGARDIGIGDDPALKLLIQVITAFASGTSLTVALQGAPDNGSAAPGTWVTWWSSPAVLTASLTAGARLYDMDMPRPPAGVAVPRFLRLAYTGSGTYTAGSIEGCIVLDRMDQMYNATANAVMGGYPPGVVINN
jgi:hypothetical protein